MEIGRSLGMTIHRLWGTNLSNEARAIERLSSGLRINRASDDAAGLQISDRLTSQVRGTNQAIRNAQDGLDLLRVADGAFGTIMDVMQRMRQLTVQGANGSLTSNDRAAIQTELEQLKSQIDATAYFTQYNGLSLLVNQDKTYSAPAIAYNYNPAAAVPAGYWNATPTTQAAVALAGGPVSGVTMADLTSITSQLPELVEGARRMAEALLSNSGINQASYLGSTGLPLQVNFVVDASKPTTRVISNGDFLTVNLYPFFGSGVAQGVSVQQAIAQAMGYTIAQRAAQSQGGSYTTNVDAFVTPTGVDDSLAAFFQMGTGSSYLAYGQPAGGFAFTTTGGLDTAQKSAWFYRYMLENYGQGSIDRITHLITDDPTVGSLAAKKASITANLDAYLLATTGQTSKTNLVAAVNAWMTSKYPNPAATNYTPTSGIANTAANVQPQALNSGLVLQIGANQGETLKADLFAGALGNLDYLAMTSVMDQNAAMASITTIDKAIATVSGARTRLGATENQLEHTINRLSSYEVDGQASLSRIRDTDVAAEASSLARSQILAQASASSLQRFQQISRERTGTLLQGLNAG